MAASDPVGGQKFWFNGVPYQGVAKPGTDTLGLKYWFNGVPVQTVIPGGVTPPTDTYAAFSTPQHDGESVVQMVGT